MVRRYETAGAEGKGQGAVCIGSVREVDIRDSDGQVDILDIPLNIEEKKNERLEACCPAENLIHQHQPRNHKKALLHPPGVEPNPGELVGRQLSDYLFSNITSLKAPCEDTNALVEPRMLDSGCA